MNIKDYLSSRSKTDAEKRREEEERQSLIDTALKNIDDNTAIRVSKLFPDFEPGIHAQGDIYNAAGQTWECYADFDNAEHPDIIPENDAWRTFNRPLHGVTPETARPYAAPTGSHDMYKIGEYMIHTDGKTYKCIMDAAYSPEEFGSAWEVV
ncbi:MAG: hypothetical protein IJ449_11765 [Clostridia bacterium]|nr:hypothetical protein [Clostridia bacterium]